MAGRLVEARAAVTPRAWVVLAVLAAVAGGSLPFLRKGRLGTTEFPVYTRGADRMLAGEEIYRPTEPKPFTYPPFFALPFALLPSVPLEPPRPWPPFLLWYAINVAALAWIVRLVHRRAGGVLPAGRARIWFWLVVAVLAGRHLTAVFENQSHDLLVLLLVLLGVEAWCRGRPAGAGAWLGLGAACKATPLLFLGPLVLQRRWLALAAMAATVVLATLAPDLLVPRGDGGSWVGAWFSTFLSELRPGETADVAGAWNAGSVLNQSLSGTLHRLLTPVQSRPEQFVWNVALFDAGPVVRAWVLRLASLLVLGVLALATWPWPRPDEPAGAEAWRRFGQASAVVCGMVLLSPMSSKSHFCVLLLPIAFCTAHYLRTGRDRVLPVFGAVALVLGPLASKGLIGARAGGWLLAYGSVTWVAAAALGATCHVLFARSGARQ